MLAGPSPASVALAQAEVERAQVEIDRVRIEVRQSISDTAHALALVYRVHTHLGQLVDARFPVCGQQGRQQIF